MTDPTIQSPTGPTSDAGGRLVVSLSEIDAMTRKAVRGAGYAWGVAEEAGRAVRRLAVHRLNGPGIVADLLETVSGNRAGYSTITTSAREWTADADGMCPLNAGILLSDRARLLEPARPVVLTGVLNPALLVPFAAEAAKLRGDGLLLTAGPRALAVMPDGRVAATLPGFAALYRSTLTLTVGHRDHGGFEPAAASADGYPVTADVWRRLDTYARETYVPASEASRNAGAGAGLTDND